MKMYQLILGCLLLMSMSVPLYADIYEPVPQCYEPSKPLWFTSFYYKKRYNNDVKQYRECIKFFIEKQNDAAKTHSKAAQDALEIWNDFVKGN